MENFKKYLYNCRFLPLAAGFLILYFALSVVFTLFGMDAIIGTIITDILISVLGVFVIRRYFGKYNNRRFSCISFRYIIYISCLLLVCWLFSQITATWYLTNVGDVSFDVYQDITTMNPVAYLLLSAVFAPVAEEVIYRGVIFNSVKKGFPVWIAYVVSAFVFAFMHGTVVHMIIGFVCGILFAVVYQYTKSLRISILMHAAYNVLSLCAGFINVPDVFFEPYVFGVIDIILVCVITLECCRVSDAQRHRRAETSISKMPEMKMSELELSHKKVELICDGNHDADIKHGTPQVVSFAKGRSCPYANVVSATVCDSYFMGACYSETGVCPQEKSE